MPATLWPSQDSKWLDGWAGDFAARCGLQSGVEFVTCVMAAEAAPCMFSTHRVLMCGADAVLCCAGLFDCAG
jgi:hypothetical protein